MSVREIAARHVDANVSNDAVKFEAELRKWRRKLAEQLKAAPTTPTLPPVRLFVLLSDFDAHVIGTVRHEFNSPFVELLLETLVRTAAARIETQLVYEKFRLLEKNGR